MIHEDVVLFSSGRHFVLYDISKHRQQFIVRQTEDDEVLTYNVLVNLKLVINIGVALKIF